MAYGLLTIVLMKLKDLQFDQWPREKALKNGFECLGDVELIAILLGSGCFHAKMDALELATIVMSRFQNWQDLFQASISELKSINGIGNDKAIKIKAAIEIGRRFIKPVLRKHAKFSTSQDVFNYYYPIFKAKRQEELWVLLLNSKNEFISDKIIFKGCLDHCSIHQRDIFNYVIRENAAAFILIHNHPSGNCQPSLEDIQITTKIQKGAKIMNLSFLDHIIIGEAAFWSMKNELKNK